MKSLFLSLFLLLPLLTNAAEVGFNNDAFWLDIDPVRFNERGSSVPNPATGTQYLYLKQSDHHLYLRNSSGTETQVDGGGGGGTPAGSSTQLQYNTSGSFDASSNLTFDNSTKTFSITGSGAKYLVGTNAQTVATNYSLSNVVLGAVAKGTTAAENLAFFGSSDSSSPLGLVIRNQNNSSGASREVDLQANDIGNVVRTLRLNPDGGDVNIQSIVGSIIYDNSHLDSINIGNRNLIRSNGIALDWNQDQLIDESSVKSLDWNVRQAFASDGVTVNADWSSSGTGGLQIRNPVINSDSANNMLSWFDNTGSTLYGSINSFGQMSIGNTPPTDAVLNLAPQNLIVPSTSSVTVTLDFTDNAWNALGEGTVFSRTIYNIQSIDSVTTYAYTGADASYTENFDPDSLSVVINTSESGYTADGSTHCFDVYDLYDVNYSNPASGGTPVCVTDDGLGEDYGIDMAWTQPGNDLDTDVIAVREDDTTFIDLGQGQDTFTDDNNTGWNPWGGTVGPISWDFDISWTNPAGSNGSRIIDNTNAQYIDNAQGVTSIVDDNSAWASGTTNTPNVFPARPIDSSGQSFFGAATNSDIIVTIKEASGQSGDMTEWQNSSATVLAKMDQAGTFTATGVTSTAGMSSTQNCNNCVTLSLVKKTGQFGHHLDFKDDAFAVLSYVDIAGDFVAPSSSGAAFFAGKDEWVGCGQRTTTNNTPAAGCTVGLTDNTIYLINAKCVARKSTTGVISFEKTALWYRVSGGGATQKGTTNAIFVENSDSTSTNLTFAASGNGVQINVVGATSETWVWDCSYNQQTGGL